MWKKTSVYPLDFNKITIVFFQHDCRFQMTDAKATIPHHPHCNYHSKSTHREMDHKWTPVPGKWVPVLEGHSTERRTFRYRKCALATSNDLSRKLSDSNNRERIKGRIWPNYSTLLLEASNIPKNGLGILRPVSVPRIFLTKSKLQKQLYSHTLWSACGNGTSASEQIFSSCSSWQNRRGLATRIAF